MVRMDTKNGHVHIVEICGHIIKNIFGLRKQRLTGKACLEAPLRWVSCLAIGEVKRNP